MIQTPSSPFFGFLPSQNLPTTLDPRAVRVGFDWGINAKIFNKNFFSFFQVTARSGAIFCVPVNIRVLEIASRSARTAASNIRDITLHNLTYP